MQWIASIAGLLVALAAGYGGYVAGQRRPPPAPTTSSPEPAAPVSERRATAFNDRLQTLVRWHEALTAFHQRVLAAGTVAEMAQTMADAIAQTFAEAAVVIGIGPTKDILLLDTLAALRAENQHLDDSSCAVANPAIDASLLRELVNDLSDLARRQPASERWLVVREVEPELHARLGQRFHILSRSIVVPLQLRATVIGVLLLSAPDLDHGVDALVDYGRFAAIACDVMTTWLRCMAPQLLAGTARDPVQLAPMPAIASLSVLEQSVGQAHESEESREILGELATYSRIVESYGAEIALLANQTCASLRRICNADLTMFLRLMPEEDPPTFAVEAIEAGEWSWTSYQGYRGEAHPVLGDRVLRAWPDAFARQTASQPAPIHARTDDEVRQLAPRLADLGCRSLLVVPALVRSRCVGLLVAARYQPGGFAELPILVATSVASLAALSQGTLHLLHQQAQLQRTADHAWKLASAISAQAIASLAAIVQKRSIVSVANPLRVAQYAEAIAYELECPPVEVSQIRIAALLCDLGMIVIPSSLLRKESGLTDDEMQLIQRHPEISVELLNQLDLVRGSLPIIQHHHERYDGKGYPRRLHGLAIPQGARIVAAADMFVTLQLDRPYRPALGFDEACAVVRQEAGRQLDPEVAAALLAVAQRDRVPVAS